MTASTGGCSAVPASGRDRLEAPLSRVALSAAPRSLAHLQPQRSEPVEIRTRWTVIPDDSIEQDNQSIGLRSHADVVCDDDDGLPVLVSDFGKKVSDVMAAGRI